MVSFENFVKSMPPSLLELKVIPSFCFTFKISDNLTASNLYGSSWSGLRRSPRGWMSRKWKRAGAFGSMESLGKATSCESFFGTNFLGLIYLGPNFLGPIFWDQFFGTKFFETNNFETNFFGTIFFGSCLLLKYIK